MRTAILFGAVLIASAIGIEYSDTLITFLAVVTTGMMIMDIADFVKSF